MKNVRVKQTKSIFEFLMLSISDQYMSVFAKLASLV